MMVEKNHELHASGFDANNDKNKILNKLLKIIFFLVIALVSYVWIAEYTASPEHHVEIIEALEEKHTQVLELTALSTALSMGVSALPDDIGTPIAQKLADISTYLILILCAIFLEKYLVTITGYAAFKILIPVACLLSILYILWNSEGCFKLAKKVFMFGIAIYLVVPTSIRVSNLIENTYQLSVEVSDVVTEEELQIEESSQVEESTEKMGLWEKVKSSIADFTTNVEKTVTQSVENVEEKINIIIEGVAVMIVTSCILPIALLFFFTWIIRIILGIDINFKIPKVKGKVIKIKHKK